MVESRDKYLASNHTAFLPPAIKFNTLPSSIFIPIRFQSALISCSFAVANSFVFSFPSIEKCRRMRKYSEFP